VGYRAERIRWTHGTVEERLVTITTDIAQVLPDGKFLMIDSEDLSKGEAGKCVFAIIRDLITGKQTSTKYYKFGEHILPNMWVEHKYRRQYETERDYG